MDKTEMKELMKECMRELKLEEKQKEIEGKRKEAETYIKLSGYLAVVFLPILMVKLFYYKMTGGLYTSTRQFSMIIIALCFSLVPLLALLSGARILEAMIETRKQKQIMEQEIEPVCIK